MHHIDIFYKQNQTHTQSSIMTKFYSLAWMNHIYTKLLLFLSQICEFQRKNSKIIRVAKNLYTFILLVCTNKLDITQIQQKKTYFFYMNSCKVQWQFFVDDIWMLIAIIKKKTDMISRESNDDKHMISLIFNIHITHTHYMYIGERNLVLKL